MQAAALYSALASEPAMRAPLPHGIAGLLVDGDGIMRLGVHAGVIEKFQEPVPLGRVLRFDDVKMKNMAVARRFVGQVECLAPLSPAV